MNKNQRWLNMLSRLNINPTDDIISGSLVNTELLKDNKTWRLTLEFDSLLPCNKVNSLMASIKNYMFNNLNAIDCKFTFCYRDKTIVDDLIEEYFHDGIRVLSTVRKEILILERYKVMIFNNEIRLFVFNDAEQKVVDYEFFYLLNYIT